MRVVKSQLSYCLDLLAVMAGAPRGSRLTDLAIALHAPKSSTQRLLDHLAHHGWVEQDAATGHHRLTMRLAVLGQRYLHEAGIAGAAQGVLNRLARRTRELARLTVVDGQRLAWIASAQGAPAGLRYEPSMGAPIRSFTTANGKAWLARLSDEEAVAIALADGLGSGVAGEGIGPNAITDTAAFIRELANVRRRGYAAANEEAEPGVAALAVAIRDPQDRLTLGTTSIAGPVVRLKEGRHTQLVEALREAASELAEVWPVGSLPVPRQAGSAGRKARRRAS